MLNLFISYKRLCCTGLIVLFAALLSCSDDDNETQVLGPPTITGYSENAMLSGGEITISGTNFGKSKSNAAVTFYNESEADIVSISNTAITVTVPDDAYVGTIKVAVKDQEVTGPIFYVLTFCSTGMGGMTVCNRYAP